MSISSHKLCITRCLTSTTLEKEFAPELLKELQDLEKQAVNHANEGRLQDALDVLNQCITREPDYASAYNNR